jgi:L-methionine (R)-S-oxide reductase
MTTHAPGLTESLTEFIARNAGVAGSVHLRRGEQLVLAASHNLPASVREATAVVPSGKGMAGLAMQHGEPIQTCNLRTDSTGNVQPGARAVGASAAVALPVRSADRDVRAVVGIAFGEEREISEAEIARLQAESAALVSDRY